MKARLPTPFGVCSCRRVDERAQRERRPPTRLSAVWPLRCPLTDNNQQSVSHERHYATLARWPGQVQIFSACRLRGAVNRCKIRSETC